MKCSNCGNNKGTIVLNDEVVCPRCYLDLTDYMRNEAIGGDGDGVDF